MNNANEIRNFMYSNINPDCPTDFPKLVLSWSFSTFEKPLPRALQQPSLPRREKSIPQYYRNFMPFILEEARAIIAGGVDKVNQYSLLSIRSMGKKNKSTAQLNDAKPFRLILKKKPRFPQNEENPLSMTFAGAIPEKIEHGKSMNVLLLKTTGISPEKRFIALASENFESTELFVKIILSREEYESDQKCFENNAQWQAHYLGSVISEQRMYDACLAATNIPCVQQIARSLIPEPDLSTILAGRADINNLNLSQREAIQAFLNAKEGSIVLLQGPPGTGKTTTVVKLLKQVATDGNRILVSAHSNKGVQVLASRALKDMPDIPMMLVGVESKISEELKPIFLHRWHDRIASYLTLHTELIELCADGQFLEIGTPVGNLITEISNSIGIAQKELDKFQLLYFNRLDSEAKTDLYRLMPNPISMSDFQEVQRNLNVLNGSPYAEEKWQFFSGILTEIVSKWKKVNRSKLELYLLNHAKIIFATLITSGRDSMLAMDAIDFLLVDEAAQSVEAATLIPMQYKPSKVLLVGDTKQLPATVISKMLDDDASGHAHSTHYKWSMMWRLIEENNEPNLMLTIQYRMHPHICQWPSSQYYGDRLITSPQILPMKLLSSAGITSRPYAIYEVSGQDITEDYSYSICNHEEAKYVMDIIGLIRKECPKQSIGVITPYVAQKRLVNEKLKKRRPSFEMVDVNTVDGFQGDERDIIIMSFTRTHVSQFLKEFRRLNVAITRPKYSLIILGSPQLSSSDIGELFEDARLRGVLYPEHALKTILRTGSVLTIQERQPASDLKSLAWQADPHSQFMYAQAIEPRDKSSAYVWYRRSAENNHAEAQYHVSQFYLTDNNIIKKDAQLGVQWLKKAAEQALPAAEYALGMEFITGKHIRQDISVGMDLCERAANKNFIYAILLLAKCYEEGINVTRHTGRSQAYYRRAAKLGHTEAMMKLAASLTQGNIENKREAVKWYRNAANCQVVAAYYPLAELLNEVLDDQIEALKWYCKSADAGEVNAQYKVAVRFRYGTHGCAINLAKAVFYLRQASAAEHIESQFMLATCLNEGVGVSVDKQEAMVYFQRAADKGHNESRYQFAVLKEKEAVHVAYSYYLKAANNYHRLAQYACIRYQLQFNRDLEKCLQFGQKLATDDEPALQFLLARLLHTGVANMKDEAKAYYYYSRLLIDGDNTLAYFYCANMLETGRGVKQDLKLARHYYTQCYTKLSIAQLYFARLLLQADDYENNDKRAIEIVDSYRADKNQQIKVDFTLDYYLAQQILQIPLPNFSTFICSIDTASAYANYWLGMLFKEGYNKVKQDDEKAIKFLQKAADNGHMEAQYQVGLLLAKVSRYASYSYYKQAAQQGHRLAQEVCILYQLEIKRDLSDCLHFCEQLAVVGNRQMQFLLARLLDSGIAGTIDKAKAYHYYALLANGNVPLAEYYCGNLLEAGIGIDRNISLACEYYERCAEKIPLAKLRLARLLLDFKNDKHNEQKAVDILKSYHANFNEETIVDPWLPNKRLQPLLIEDVWVPDFSLFICSIETASIYANYSLGMLFKNGDKVKQNDRKAAMFFKKSAACGHAGSLYQLGLLNEKQSRQLAYPLYKKAAEQEHPDALYECIRYQLEFRQDLPCCLDFCKKVVMQNAFPVQFMLARLLDSGIAGYTDKPSAYRYYLQAVEKAHPIAAYYCGYMAEHGIGIDQSLSLATQYYERCIQQSFPAKLRLACLLLQYRTYIQDERVLAEKEKQAIELLKSYYRDYQDTSLDRLNELEKLLEKIIIDVGRPLYRETPLIKTQSIEANYYLGRILEEGKGVPVNIPRALDYYRAISRDFPEATYRIGYIHEFGVGNTPRNKDVAKECYESAANRGHPLAAKRLTLTYSFFSLVADKDDKTLIEDDNKNCLVM